MSYQHYARFDTDDVTVIEVFIMWDGPPIEKYFPPVVVTWFHPCPDYVEVGWTYNDVTEEWSRPVTP